MSVELIVLFLITVLPLICTPGPDILFAASQGVSGGKRAALRAVAGVLLGYSAHAVLSALGIAALIAASPVLFMTLKWLGVGYLAYLALQLFRSSLQKRGDIVIPNMPQVSLWRGFLTSFLNPKGLIMYLAILPQFVSSDGNAVIQILILSTFFVFSCGVVYGVIGLASANVAGRPISDRARRKMEAISGLLLTGAAAKIAAQ